MHEAPPWHGIWKEVVATIERDVSDFNDRSGSSLTASRIGRVVKSLDEISLGIQIVPTKGPVEPLVLQIDPRSAIIQFDATIARPGGPCRSFYDITGAGLIALKEHVVGQPQPTADPMTPQQFSRFVLQRLLKKGP